MLKTLPVSITRKEIQSLLPEYGERIKQIFASHSDPSTYDLRGVTLYGISECLRAEAVQSLLIKGNYAALGQLMKISHDGDRIHATDFSDAVLDALATEEADPMLQCGAYGCSTPRIDALCDLLNATPGVLGSSLVGAGLGGCIIALIEKQAADSVISVLNTKFHDKEGLPRSAVVYTPSAGSKVIY
jgi:galactokinase